MGCIKNDGTVVTWGNVDYGGDSSSVQDELVNVKKIYSNWWSFTALKYNGTLVSWGNASYGGGDIPPLTEIIEVIPYTICYM